MPSRLVETAAMGKLSKLPLSVASAAFWGLVCLGGVLSPMFRLFSLLELMCGWFATLAWQRDSVE